MGDSVHFKSLLPHPKAALFLEDFKHNYTLLSEYLNYLILNETAYEEHRSWRYTYTHEKHSEVNVLLQKPWSCRICEWAIDHINSPHKLVRVCDKDSNNKPSETIVIASTSTTRNPENSAITASTTVNQVSTPENLEGQIVRGNSRQVYFIGKNKLRKIPDLETFLYMNFKPEKVIILSDETLSKYKLGDDILHHD